MQDLVIIGLGPAGITASIYASCFKLSHVVIGKIVGGQMSYAPDILNYPGFTEVTGTELTQRMLDQAKKYNPQIINENVNSVKKIEGGFEVITETNQIFQSKTIILATGVERRKLGVKGENEYLGKGIQYCAKCDKFDYENKITTVIGGANSAAQTVLQLSHAAKKVYMIHRGSSLRADPILQSQIEKSENIEIIYNSKVKEIIGDSTKVTGITIESGDSKNPETIQTKNIDVERVFIEIGGVPGTALLSPLGVNVDPGGFIEVDETLSTSAQGVFAAGDVVSHKYSIEQISSAVGSGARAATSIFSYLKQQNAPSLWGASQIQRAK